MNKSVKTTGPRRTLLGALLRPPLGTLISSLTLAATALVGCNTDEEPSARGKQAVVIDPGAAWVALGPFDTNLTGNTRGGIGRATVAAVNPQNRYNVWLGTAGGGLWVRNNAVVGGTPTPYDPTTFTPFDGGWVPFNGPMQSHAIGAIVLNTCNANGCTDVYVGTGENNLRRDTYYGNGLYQASFVRRGEFASWEWNRLDESEQFKYGTIQKILPTDAGLFVALSVGNTTTATHATVRAPEPVAGFGVHRLTVGGWTQVFDTTASFDDDWADLLLPTDLEEDPTTPGALYLGVMNDGIFRSTDDGVTWTSLNPGSRLQAASGVEIPTTISDGSATTNLPAAGSFDHVEIAVDEASGAVFAMFGNCPATADGIPFQRAIGYCAEEVDDGMGGTVTRRLLPWVYRLGSGGVWQAVDSPGSDTSTSDVHYSRYTHTLEIHPDNPSIYYHGGLNLTKLTEASPNWTQDILSLSVSTTGTVDYKTHLDFQDLQVFPGWDSGSDVFYAASDGGFYYMSTRDNVWHDANTGLQISELYSIGIDYQDEDPTDANPRTTAIIGGFQDNSCMAFNGTTTWMDIGSCGDGAEALIQTPTIFYTSDQHNGIEREPGTSLVTRNGGVTTRVRKSSAGGARPPEPIYDKDISFAVPYVQHEESKRLYIATEFVSVLEGSEAAWPAELDSTSSTIDPIIISPNFGEEDSTSYNFSPIESDRNVITALAVAPSSEWTIYAGFYNGQLHGVSAASQPSPDDWNELAATGLPDRTISSIAVHPSNPQELWVTISDFGVPTVFRSGDGGATFEARTTNLPPNVPANVIKIDPEEPNKLWLGTDTGVYQTVDGVNWEQRTASLPIVPVFDIEIDAQAGNIIAATHGRGVWLIKEEDPLLTVFEGWMDDGIWDVAINGVNFNCTGFTNCACTVNLYRTDGTLCASGNLDGTGSPIYVEAGDHVLRTSNYGSCTECDGKGVIFGCFNGDCVYNDTDPGPTPLVNCLGGGGLATVEVDCDSAGTATGSTGALCPEQLNPPGGLIEVDPVLPGTAPAAPAGGGGGGAGAKLFSISASVLASPGNGGDQVLCSATAAFDSSMSKGEIQSALDWAINNSPDCSSAGVGSLLLEPVVDRIGEDQAGADVRLRLRAPEKEASQIVPSFSVLPGDADGLCFDLSELGVYLQYQLAITQLRFLTAEGGAVGGDITVREETALGSCEMTISTTAGQTGEQIAAAIADMFNAPETPFPISCSEAHNPRDMVQDGDSVVTILPTGLRVCVMDPGVGLTFGPHGIDVPLPTDPVLPYSDITLLGTDRVYIGQRTEVRDGNDFGLVANSGVGTSTLMHDVQAGEVQSVGPVTLTGATVYGTAASTATVSLTEGATASNVVEGAQLFLPGLEPFAVEFPTMNQGPVALEPGETQAIDPGPWDTVSVKSGATLKLSSGTYYFNTLQVLEPQATFELDQDNGPVRINIRDQFTYRGSTITTTNGAEPDLLIVYTGSEPAFIESPFKGTAVAPSAELALQANNGQTHRGAFFAYYLRVEPDAIIEHVPFSELPGAVGAVSCGDGSQNQDETDVDCGGSCGPTCDIGQQCDDDGDCASANCSSGSCAEGPGTPCTAATATDMGSPGTSTTVASDGCLRVSDGFPSWWGTRNLQLQSQDNNDVPIPYAWSSDCSSASGNGTITQDWQSDILPGVSDACPVVIDLRGTGSGNAKLTYYAN